MIKTANTSLTMDQLIHRLISVYERIHDSGDSTNAKKTLELIKKARDGEFVIGFCGHFSAGKSSMINELMGEKILPSSPIPTSANIVKIKSGQEYVRIYNKKDEIIEYPLPYHSEMIQTYCKNGDEIELLEISHQTDELPKGVTVMDTPGIDSTDDAHQKSTMSALHLADVILYVMDYNHVQSEQNFQFTKMLKDSGKKVYLVINQIDKHREQEISLIDFKNGVKQSFRNWHVEPDAIFYTSLRDKTLPYNELTKLKSMIADKIEFKNNHLIESIMNSINMIIHDHFLFLKEKSSSEVQKYETILSPLSSFDIGEISSHITELEQKISEQKGQVHIFEKKFLDELQNVLNNAYMMPFEIRELAKLFLEASQPNFKVGLFFTKAKTEKEKENRLTNFYQKLRENVTNQLERHIQQLAITFLKNWHITNSSLVRKAQTLSVSFEPSLLEQVLKKGARVTGEYILLYTEEVANEIKKRYKMEALSFVHETKQEISTKIDLEIQDNVRMLSKYKEYEHAAQQLNIINESHDKILKSLKHIVEGKLEDNYRSATFLGVTQFLETKIIKKEAENHPNQSKIQPEIETVISSDENVNNSSTETHRFNDKVIKIVANLRNASKMIKKISGFSLISREMEEKANRLEGQNFTVALFGAFSAGKSSFANALIGGSILPVSPNPTTATINKILPPNEQHKHGTVKVKLKSREQLLEDIKYSLHFFDIKVSSLDEAVSIIQKKLTVAEIGSREKTHYNFLKAVDVGFLDVTNKLGEIIEVGLEGFKDYVAKEEKACFVEWIELYYDCPLTQKGITLVDTPGADSVNARHTGVAFEYIKNADAILFVTYYNHAFSKADREFLIQLGRVKDTFAMDKMFFIVNAADLAASQDELTDVVQYVGNQLIQYGIRKPRLYPVSSQFALAEKCEGAFPNTSILTNSGIAKFEADFNRFIIEELTEMTVKSAVKDLNRLKHVLEKYIQSAKESNEMKAEKLKIAMNEQETLHAITNNLEIQNEQEAIIREINELIYYIRQRIFLRFPDIFKESFNPSVLRDDNSNIKNVLKKCLQELLEFIEKDLAQEIRATSLRIEKYIQMKVNDVFTIIEQHSKKIQDAIELATLEQVYIRTFDIKDGDIQLDYEDKQFKKALSIYKNAKSFFEKNEKRFMSEEIEQNLQEPVSSYLNKSKNLLIQFYQVEFEEVISKLKSHIKEQVTFYYAGMKSALENKTNLQEMEDIKAQISIMIKEYE